jgi:hypothetical protein
MEHLIILKPNGDRLARLYGAASPVKITKGEQKKKLLGENTVTLTVESVDPISFAIGDSVKVFGETYYLNLLPKVERTSDKHYIYDITFESAQYELSKIVFLDEDKKGLSTSSEFTLMANLAEIVAIICNNMNRVYGAGKWVVGSTPTTDRTSQNFASNNCLAVLQQICSDNGTEFSITEASGIHTINIGKQGSLLPYTLRYGRGRGLYTLTRENISSSNIVTRLYAYGGTQNLPSNYRNYSDRLRLPDTDGSNRSFIEDADAVAAFGVLEGVKTWDDIYPHHTGTVTAIVSGDPLSFVDSTMDFDLNATDSEGNTKYLIAGVTAKITFKTGGLAGYQFEVASYDTASKTFKINKYTDHRGVAFPSDSVTTFQIKTGDTFVITDVYPRQTDIDQAEALLLTKAKDYLALNKAPRVQYDVEISEDYLVKIGQLDKETEIVNIFHVGDTIGLIDDEVGVNRTGDNAIRITEFTRDIMGKTSYSYKFGIADTLEVTEIERILSDQGDIDNIITINQLTDVTRMQRSWRTTQELLSMIFDQDGYFKDGNIRPNSIETQMLSVGAKAQQFILKNVVIEPNYKADPNVVNVTAGSLIHYGLGDTEADIRTWNLSTETTTLTNTGALYIYARCDKGDANGHIVFSNEKHKVEDNTYYWFIIGVLHSVDSSTNTRWISLTYGASSINGRFIKTGRVQSADGSTWFDLDSGEIHGKITFGNNNTSLEDTYNIAMDANDYITKTLPGIIDGINTKLDGVVDTYFGDAVPTASNAPASSWTDTKAKEEHLGDLYYNNSTGIGYRWSKSDSTGSTVYSWVEVRDSGVTQALAAAAKAQDTADGKRRVFVSTPYPPYDPGDLWTDGADLYRCNVGRTSGNYIASDWGKATGYTGDENLNAFINGVFKTTIDNIGTEIDGKIDNYYTTTDPAVNWTDDTTRAIHVGDTWYDTGSKKFRTYQYKTIGELLSKFTVDGVFYSNNVVPTLSNYPAVNWTTESLKDNNVGMIYYNSSNKGVYQFGRDQQGNWAWTDISTEKISEQAVIFTKYVYNGYRVWINQPSSYSTGDFYIKGGYLYQCQKSSSGVYAAADWKNLGNTFYWWQIIEDTAAIAAAEAASRAQDTADGKRRVFVVQPYPPYDSGDLWVNGTDIKRCVTSRVSGSYVASDWGLASNYDNTKTTIDGGIVTSGTIQLAGDSGSILAGITGQGTASTSVRIWAGATFDSRASAPFRVLQSGEVFARYRIELQDTSLNGLAGICGQGMDDSDTGIRFWAGSTYANRTSAPFRVLKDGSVVMSKATINNGCTIGSWEVSNGGIFNDSGEAYIIARKAYGDGNYTEARIGTSVFPASSGIVGCGYFENTMSNPSMTNIGIVIDVENAANNIAISAKGSISSISGFVGPAGYQSYTLQGNTVTILGLTANTFLISCYTTGAGVGLPDRYSVAEHLGIGTSTPFSVTVRIIAKKGSTQGFSVYGRNTSLKNSSGVYFMNVATYPYWLDNDANIQNGGLAMEQGDITDWQLTWDGSNYYAYFILRHD